MMSDELDLYARFSHPVQLRPNHCVFINDLLLAPQPRNVLGQIDPNKQKNPKKIWTDN